MSQVSALVRAAVRRPAAAAASSARRSMSGDAAHAAGEPTSKQSLDCNLDSIVVVVGGGVVVVAVVVDGGVPVGGDGVDVVGGVVGADVGVVDHCVQVVLVVGIGGVAMRRGYRRQCG